MTLDLSQNPTVSTIFNPPSPKVDPSTIFPSNGTQGPNQGITIPKTPIGDSTFPSIGGNAPISMQSPVPPPVPTTITGANTTPTTPVSLPPTPLPNTSIQSALATNPVPIPLGTTLPSVNGVAPPPPPTTTSPPTTTPSVNDTTRTSIQTLLDQLAGKSTVNQTLNDTYGLDAKTKNAQDTYNAYQQAKLASDQQLEAIRTSQGGTKEGNAQQLDQVSRANNANLANLAVIAQAGAGNLQAAQSIIKAKLDAQFQPIQDQIDYLTKYVATNNSNLTESEKVQLENQRFQLQTNLDTLKTAKANAHQFALTQGITDQSVLQAIDAATTPADVYKAVSGNANGVPSVSTSGNMSNISPQYQPYVTQSYDGTPYVNQDQLKNLTPFQAQEAARQYAQAGIKVLQPDEASKIQNIDVTRQNLDQLGTVTKQILGAGLYGRTIGPAWNKISQVLQLNPEIASFNSYRDTAINTIQALAGGSGSGFRLNQAEIDTAASNIPTITDNLETATKKIDNLNSFLNKWTKELLPKSNVNTGVVNNGSTGNLPIVQTKVGAINPNF